MDGLMVLRGDTARNEPDDCSVTRADLSSGGPRRIALTAFSAERRDCLMSGRACSGAVSMIARVARPRKPPLNSRAQRRNCRMRALFECCRTRAPVERVIGLSV